ncbi:MAG: tripartite tricarboxylate transporter permease [Thermoplasmata archaeon]|nr:tripartite tricarboxylate transporter permease [Thermoplasmata archaeon]
MNDFALVIIFSTAGALMGMITGLIPGLHTNNIALLMLFLLPFFEHAALYFALFIVSAAISHTFHDIIPSTFIGAPEDDTALAVLPAHSMVMRGEGYKAIVISAISSFLSIVACFLLLLPFCLLMGEPFNLYNLMEKNMAWILLSISLIMILTSRNILHALFIFLLSGVFGIVALKIPSSFLISSSPLFPALAGLFGAPALLTAKRGDIPEQRIGEDSIKLRKRDVGSGVLSGGLVSMLPGVSAAVATTLAMAVIKEAKDENVISILSATNTATNFFVLVALFVLLKARSGFAIAIEKMIYLEKWNGMIKEPFNLFLIAIIISAIISYYLTIHIGRMVAKNISKISYPMLVKISLVIILAMIFLFNGPSGLLIFGVGVAIGMLCLEMKVRRSICMGVLLLPLLIKYFL